MSEGVASNCCPTALSPYGTLQRHLQKTVGFIDVADVPCLELVKNRQGCAMPFEKPKAGEISEPLPDEFRHSIEELLAENQEFPAMDCAACVGQEFTVDEIGRGVRMPRLELIQLFGSHRG